MIPNKKYISVIIPTFNRAYLLNRSIISVLNQTNPDFELIIVDDGSTDDTTSVINSFKDNRIKYIRHQINKGANAARNTGIKVATGDYIAFQDSDDEWRADKLEKQLNVLRTAPPEVGVVHSGCIRIKDGVSTYFPLPGTFPKEGRILKGLLRSTYVALVTVLVRRKCFDIAGLFDESLPRLQDWELFIRISKYFQFVFIDEPLVTIYYVKDSISANDRALGTALKLVLDKHFDEFNMNRSILADKYLEIGDLLFLKGEDREGRIYFAKAIKAAPFRINSIFRLFISLFGVKAYNIKFNSIHLPAAAGSSL